MRITAFYAALLALLFIGLSVRTLLLRRRLQVAVGDAGNPELLRAMRVHANFAEYVPLTLLLFAFAEAHGAAGLAVHAGLASLLVGRVSHAYGVSRVDERYLFRVIGVGITLTVLGFAAVYLLFAFARG